VDHLAAPAKGSARRDKTDEVTCFRGGTSSCAGAQIAEVNATIDLFRLRFHPAIVRLPPPASFEEDAGRPARPKGEIRNEGVAANGSSEHVRRPRGEARTVRMAVPSTVDGALVRGVLRAVALRCDAYG